MQLVARDLSTLDAQYFRDLFVVRALTLAGYAILLYEAFDTLPDEVEHIWPTRWSTVKVLYLTNRYGNLGVLGAMTLQMLGLWRSDAYDFCYHLTLALSLIEFMSYASVHVLVLLRAWATWGRHVKILVTLVSLFVIYAATSITILTWGIVSGGSDAYPQSSITGTCIGYIRSPAWILWIPSILLESAIFTLTMVSVRKFDAHLHIVWQSSIVRVIMRDAILYFVLTLFSSLLNIFVWAFYGDRPLNMLANNFTLCLMIAAGQRLVLDLRKVSSDDTLSTTRVGREVERAMEAMATDRSPSPIVFAAHSLSLISLPTPTPTTTMQSHDAPPPSSSPRSWSPRWMRKPDWGAIRSWMEGVRGRERSYVVELVEVSRAGSRSDGRRTRTPDVCVLEAT